MTDHAWPNLAAMFFDVAQRAGERPFLWSKHDGGWHAQSWAAVAREARELSAGLTALGVGAGERVLLLSENRPNWVVADLAIMAAGAVTVPAYTTNTEELHHHLLADSGARFAIVSTRALAGRLLPAAERAGLAGVVAMEDTEPSGAVAILGWDEAKARGRATAGEVEARAAAVPREALACLIYTSGTGGLPKGVMLSHHAVLANVASIRAAFRSLVSGIETFLSFLPLSHAYEHTCGLHFPISIGAEIYYAEGAETLISNLPEARPTIMTCVPRLYEVMRQRILAGVARQGGLKARLFHAAVTVGRRRLEGRRRGPLEALGDAALDRLVRSKVKARFGGRLKAMVSGGAPLNPEVGTFFQALGLTLLQGYGQTEAAPVVSANLPERVKMASVGRPLPGVEVTIAGDGEILVRGDLLMAGYWNNPEASAEALREGWLHTGDIGELDSDGFLAITDRKKDIIVNSGGDNIAPQRIEGILNLEPEIAQSMVVGDRRPHLVAVLVPEEGMEDGVRAAVERANQRLGAIERVKRFTVAREPFTIDNGQMTPTLKVRRHAVTEAYGEEIEALYGGGSSAAS